MSKASRTIRAGSPPVIAVDSVGSGEAIFFLHGVGGGRSDWATQLQFFGEHYRALAWDARGYGDSDDYAGAVTVGHFSQDLVRVLDALDIGRAHFVGLSMGGFIAQELFRIAAPRVISLTLADSAISLRRAIGIDATNAFFESRRQALDSGRSPSQLATDVVPRLLSPSATDTAVAKASLSFGSLRAQSYLKALDAVARYESTLEYASVNVPTLVIVGSEDRITPLSASVELADAIPGSRLEVMKDVGHLSNIERPDEFNHLVAEFLQSVAQRGTPP